MIIGVASADYMRADRSTTHLEVWGGSGWARLGQYVRHFRAAGHTVICGTAWNENHRNISVEDAEGHKLLPDVVILQRVMHDGLADAVKGARASGQIIINDLDDWYWGLSPSNEAFRASHPKHNKVENTRFYGATLAASSLLVASTPYLMQRISARVKCPIVVIPNYVDIHRFTPIVQTEGVPTFGWAGSTSHRSGDVELLQGVIKPFVTAGDMKIQHSGHAEGAPKFSDMLGLGSEQVKTLPRTLYDGYPSLLNFDVGMVPLRDTPFNHAKSDIKGLEYAAAGIPFIASDMPSYRQLFTSWSSSSSTGRSNPGFFLAKRGDDWIRGIKKLLDYQTRLDYQALIVDKVKLRHVDYGAMTWLSLLESLT